MNVHNNSRLTPADLIVVPTIGFLQLYVLVILWLARREFVWINVTRNLTAEWITSRSPKFFRGMKPALFDPRP